MRKILRAKSDFIRSGDYHFVRISGEQVQVLTDKMIKGLIISCMHSFGNQTEKSQGDCGVELLCSASQCGDGVDAFGVSYRSIEKFVIPEHLIDDADMVQMTKGA